MTRPPLPTGNVYEVEVALMMKLGEAVELAHELARVSPDETRALGLEQTIDRWNQDLARMYWRTVGPRGEGSHR
ncbi:hypothetical protein TSST111916_18970 [Tsukamurella strandjordii]|uniref:hypothetical protein n=1 Tax=Tsukamurella TaxID=2060 RepID=UPI001C7D2B7E|nr:hypothetical protein [Tsukamurella sp. TY48]GIZ97533.1 hypothetical protein TTY48_21450 [Tsukamurella sp. TY48]